MAGDSTRTMMEVADGKMPVWMILQIAWSDVIKAGNTLRFPTSKCSWSGLVLPALWPSCFSGGEVSCGTHSR